jgi:hypothetical protein
MQTPATPNPESHPKEAVEHITNARELLESLRAKVGEHPELADAILKLEMALNVLTMKTGALL